MWQWKGEKNPFSWVLLHAKSVKWPQAPQTLREMSLGSAADGSRQQRAAWPCSLPAHLGAVSRAAGARAETSPPACAGVF